MWSAAPLLHDLASLIAALLLPLAGMLIVVLAVYHAANRRAWRSRQRLGDELKQLHRFPQRYQRLLRILLSTKTFRVESLWKRLPAEEVDKLRHTEIPNRLRRLAKRGKKWQRVRATLLLGLLRDSQAIGLLRLLALDTDEDIATAAIAALGRYDDESNARFLVSLLSSRYPVNPSRVASVIEGMRINLQRLLLETLSLSDPKSRFWAATLLGRYPEPPVRDALIHALTDEDPNLRAAALDSLARIGDPSCGKALLQSLVDDVWYVRAHAALACGKTLLFEAMPQLLHCLSDPTWWVRHDAGKALEMLLQHDKKNQVRDLLLENIDCADPFARNMIAALLTNSGTVNELLQQFRKLGRRGEDARRMLVFIYAAGGASILDQDTDWQNYYRSHKRSGAVSA